MDRLVESPTRVQSTNLFQVGGESLFHSDPFQMPTRKACLSARDGSVADSSACSAFVLVVWPIARCPVRNVRLRRSDQQRRGTLSVPDPEQRRSPRTSEDPTRSESLARHSYDRRGSSGFRIARSCSTTSGTPEWKSTRGFDERNPHGRDSHMIVYGLSEGGPRRPRSVAHNHTDRAKTPWPVAGLIRKARLGAQTVAERGR
jgi:hypothetical protein